MKRKSNDNALAEGKNAAIVRKTFGYSHIPQHYAKKLNEFNQNVLNPYINYPELSERTGVSKSNISRLKNDEKCDCKSSRQGVYLMMICSFF